MTANFRRPGADALVCLVFLIACVALFFVDLGGKGRMEASIGLYFSKARVLTVDNFSVRRDAMLRSGEQRLDVEITRGPCSGKKLRAVNMLNAQMSIDEWYEPGDSLLLQYSLDETGAPVQGVARGHYRVTGLLWMFGIFAALLLVVSGLTGAKAVLSFLFSALILWKLLIPLYLKGWNPLLIGTPVAVAISACVCLLVGGWGRRGLAALAGSVTGLLFAMLLGAFCTDLFHIHGAVYNYSETLLYSGFPHLKLTPIFISGIVIGCSGAVMDVAMDIASAMEEIKIQNPAITYWEHIRSGLSVARAVTGTMTTTLLMAYSSGAIAMLMLFYAQGLPLVRIVNINNVSAEFLNIVIGSIGAVSVAPLTAFACGLMWREKSGGGAR